ncbi:hypothetical protein SCHPADRAFT_238887 [Schizopora paradoxa]|uniref:Uncharacterized protein n=1 Tax=Schizopora paradoxa TaxID=27342 RepID=A0A0H2RVF5_9AGAM|nr:hypothetical protein SCHPADRAFT_238887 [Schizopora paradoxa]
MFRGTGLCLPTDKRAIVERSRTNPAAALAAAKNGSHLDLSGLSEHAGQLPPKIAREVFVLFISKLASSSNASGTRIASSSDNEGPIPEIDKTEFLEATCALVGVAKILCTRLVAPSERSYYVPLVAKAWPKILGCTVYVLKTLQDALASSPERDDKPTNTNMPGFKGTVFANVAGLFFSMLHFTEVAEALARDRRSSEVVAKLWVQTPVSDPNIAMSSRALKMLCFAIGQDCSQALDCLLKECNKKVERLAELAKERLIVSLSRSVREYEEIEANIEVVLMLSDDERRSFRASFLKMKGISAATDGFIAFAKESIPKSDAKIQAVEACTSFYYHMLLSEIGLPWIIEAFRHGCLEVIARFSKSFHPLPPRLLLHHWCGGYRAEPQQ